LGKEVIMMIEYDGETYVTATEIARQFRISRGTCSTNVLPQMQACHLPGRKRALYRLSDVEHFSQVRTVAKSPCKDLPASTTTAETGSGVTSNPTLPEWTGIASIPNRHPEDNAPTERTLNEHHFVNLNH
jgi:hypothetical protein